MQKAERITEVRNSIETRSEVERRLPEIEAIYDDGVRDAVYEYFLQCCPDYFWEKPASATGKYHPPTESETHGTWLHTKRVFATYANLSESYVEMGVITDYERACGKAAALIHDTFNYGWPSSNRDMTTSEHDVIAASVAHHVADMPEDVIFLVHAHMGAWADGKTPDTPHERLFHMSDMSAADRNHEPAVYFPAEELTEQFPDLKCISVDVDEFI